MKNNLENNQELKMHKIIKLADIATLLNATSGLTAIFFSIQRQFEILFDFLDGKIARITNQQNEFGKNLDSLSDVVSFGVAPAVFGYMYGLNTFYNIIFLLTFVLAGILRLARFNILKRKEFIGIPITTSGFIIPIMYFILPFSQYLGITYLILALLMISNFKVNKI